MAQHNRFAALTGLGLAAALGVTACGGGGFEDEGDGEQTRVEGAAELTMLIASSGDAETKPGSTAEVVA